MSGIKTDAQVSERLLAIDWGKPPSGRQNWIQPSERNAVVRDLKGKNVSVKIDEVFENINAYRALIEAEISQEGLLARSLISQANAIFNQAFVALEKAFGFAKVYVDAPAGEHLSEDITELVIEEVIRLQNILDPEL
ncbi:hypothetical protein OAU50_00730 [Planctomycetota bacterium]|nr:hypothetical protein [Planctomycetota bacterium]